MKSVILTGFEPFGPYPHNPTQDAARHFDGNEVAGHSVVGMVLRCSYYEAFVALRNKMDAIKPVAVVSMGLSSRVGGVRFETRARNIMNGKYPDDSGLDPKGMPLVPGAEEFVPVHADVAALASRVHAKGIPTEVSDDAEGYICNALLYNTSQHIARGHSDARNVFLHVPWTSDYLDRISLESGKITLTRDQLRTAIEETIRGIVRQYR